MVALNTLLLVGGIAAAAGGVVVIALLLLFGIYLNVKEIKKKTSTCDDDEGGIYTIPLGGMGGGRPITQADVDQARAAIMHHRGQGPGAPGGEEKKEEKPVLGGQYL
jgi:hypothetical protein